MEIKRKKQIYYLGIISLLFTLLFNIYPEHSYSGGIDFIHYQILANNILFHNKITWLSTPLSIWGLYPLSEVVGTPCFLASLTILTKQSFLTSKIISDMIFISLSLLSIFVLFLKIERKYLFAIASGICFIFAPLLLGIDVIISTARSLVILLTPFWLLILYFLYSSNKKNFKKFLFVFILCSFSLSILHLVFLFLIPFLVSAIIVKYVFKYKNIFNLRYKHEFLKRRYLYNLFRISFWIIIIILNILIVLQLSNADVIPSDRFNVDPYQQGGFISGDSTYITIINMFISLIGGAGILFLFFGLIGLGYLISKRKNDFETIILLSFISSFIFLLTSVYFRPMFLLYSSFFVGFGFIRIKRIKLINTKLFVTLIIFLIIISSIFSSFMIYRWERNIPEGYPKRYGPTTSDLTIYLNQNTYNAGIYLRYNTEQDEKFASYKKYIDEQRMEMLSKRGRYGNMYSINELEKNLNEDWNIVKKENDILRPYKISTPIYRIYPKLFIGNFDRTQDLADKHNVSIAYTPTKEKQSGYLHTIEKNAFKIYEGRDEIFWKI